MRGQPLATLDFARHLASGLSPYGAVRLEYATAEMQPFSAGQRPDLAFEPRSGRYRGKLIFIELAFSMSHTHSAYDTQNALARRCFVAEYLERQPALHLLITNYKIAEFSQTLLTRNGIRVIDNVGTPDAAVTLIRDASGVDD